MSDSDYSAPSPTDPAEYLPLEPMDDFVKSIQPGGGVVMRLELAWGYVRRWYLRTFRRGYVRRMEQLRRGGENKAPQEVLDPRDLKFYQNQGGWHWDRSDDPFAKRDLIPFARWGLCELLLFSLMSFGPAIATAICLLMEHWTGPTAIVGWLTVTTFTVIGGLIVWFFRDPGRSIPVDEGLIVSPADGTIDDVTTIEHDEYIGGPAVQIAIFLSIFNVHVNRAPVASRVVGLTYHRGKFLNALKKESARENEQMHIRLQETSAPYRRMIVRQIAGAIARRIVCVLKPGDVLSKGERVGMIKLGSRTELVFPQSEDLQIHIKVGDKVKAGATVLAAYTGQ